MTTPNNAENFFFKRFSLDGAGVDYDLNVDGSVTPKRYQVIAARNTIITRVNLTILDGLITPSKFGGLAALTNGLKIEYRDVDDVLIYDFLDGGTIKKNHQFALLAGVDSTTIASAGDDTLPVRWTIERAGRPLLLRKSSRLSIEIADDLTGLTAFEAMAQGRLGYV